MGWALQLGGALYGASQGRKAADANKKAGQQTAAEYRAARDAAVGYQQPYLGFGQGAGGLGGLTALANGDYSGFYNAPDFKAAFDTGLNALDHSAASRLSLNSGGHEADTVKFGQNLASGFLNNYRNSLFQGAGIGQQAANQAGGYQMNAAQGIAGGLQGVANAANQRAGTNAGLGYGLAGIAGQYLPGMLGSSYGSTTPTSNYFNSGSGSSFGLPDPVKPYANTGWGH